LSAASPGILPAVSLASIEFYDVIFFLHVAAVVVGFGPTFGYAFFQSVAERSFPRSIPNVMRAMHAVDRFLVVPGILVVLAAGVYLVLEGPWDWSDTFVNVGLVVIVVLLVLALTYFPASERKLAQLAERDIAAAGDGEVKLSDEYWAASKRSALVGSLAGVLVLVALFFMVVKP
jgi:uncharacterized membrane protein